MSAAVPCRQAQRKARALPSSSPRQNQEWNEQVLWSESEGQVLGWHQGRVSFGPYGSIAAQRFRQMQLRGVPKPVTDVVEWFTYVRPTTRAWLPPSPLPPP